MATKKTAPAKKTTAKKAQSNAKKTVAKKSASASKKPQKVQHKMVAKVVSPIISVGTDDKNRSLEKFIDDIRKACAKVGVKNFTIGSHYYVVDGKAYGPDDFDVKTQQIREGAVPRFTGERDEKGRAVQPKVTTDHKVKGDERLSAREYDEKYGPGGNPQVAATIQAQKDRRRAYLEDQERQARIKRGEEFEEEEWDEDDLEDEEMHEEVVKNRTRAAVKKLKSSPKKKVVKKSGSASKKPRPKVKRRSK